MGHNKERRIDEFLDLYKQLEDVLEDKYRNSRKRYSSVVIEFSRDYDSAPVRDKLDVCREIRNLLTHNPNLEGQPIVEPSEPVLQAMREIVDFVKRPPLAIDYATPVDQVMKADLHQKVLHVMEVMDKNGFSHIPVMREGKFWGVFSAGSIFRHLLQSGGKGISHETTIAELGRQISIKEHRDHYEFVPRTETYIAVRKKFEQVKEKHSRVSVVFITENGRENERLLGMLTPWDVLGEAN